MKILVIVAHPNRASFNHAIAQTCSRALTDNGHEVIAHDLYEEHFNPMLPYGVSGRSKPATSGRIKTSHFEVR